MTVREKGLCPDDKLSRITVSLGTRIGIGARDLDVLLLEYPNDARLHFLQGAIAASAQDFATARASMRRAVDLAPDYAIARFQLGFLLLTSGEPHAAQEVWGPLDALPADNYLRLFATGLRHLIRDEFDDTIQLLREGMARNLENPAMNRDMQMIVDKVRESSKNGDRSDAPTSSVDFLLQQAALKSRLH